MTEIFDPEPIFIGHHPNAVYSVAFSSDGGKLASGSLDKTIKLWVLAAGTELQRLHGHGEAVCAVAFFNGDVSLLSASLDKTLRVEPSRPAA